MIEELTGLQIFERVMKDSKYGLKKFKLIKKEFICNSCGKYYIDCPYGSPSYDENKDFECDKYEV